MNNHELSLNQRKALALFNEDEHVSVSLVSEKLTMPRPTAKQTLVRLTELGLISRHGLGRGSFYVLKNEDEIYDTGGNKLITVYKGKNSFKDMFLSIQKELKAKDFYWSFAFKNEYQDTDLVQFLITFHQTLTDKGVEDRSIVHKDVANVVRTTYQSVPKLQIRTTDQDVPVGMIILKDRVINLVWGDKPMAIVIKSPIICQQYTDFFISVWEKSQER